MEVIKVDHISKVYKLGVYSGKTLSEDLQNWWAKKRGRKKLASLAENEKRANDKGDFWALRDINFSVNQGDVLAIIGKNGAGKSTMLKLLSRITAPTSGEIKIKGRIASLLEVGTGFHQDLSGRENIYLNGAILGMTRAEVSARLDEIIAFSGIEYHIDTPVKRYSSGMKVRLGFAVAAHLEPEILIVDEVLAVGDDEFQKKCLGKMKDVAGQGRTVLFVSHNMNAVSRLCSRAVLLNEGKLTFSGSTDEVIGRYLQLETQDFITHAVFEEQKEKDISLMEVKVLSEKPMRSGRVIDIDSAFDIHYRIKLNKPVKNAHLTFHLQNSKEEFVLFSDRKDDITSIKPQNEGIYEVSIRVPQPLLKPDRYFLSLGFVNKDNGQTNHFPSVLNFEIQDFTNARVDRAGYIFVPFEWKINEIR